MRVPQTKRWLGMTLRYQAFSDQHVHEWSSPTDPDVMARIYHYPRKGYWKAVVILYQFNLPEFLRIESGRRVSERLARTVVRQQIKELGGALKGLYLKSA